MISLYFATVTLRIGNHRGINSFCLGEEILKILFFHQDVMGRPRLYDSHV